MCRQTLDTIEIDIKDDAGDSISFQHGNLKKKWKQNFISGYSDSLLLLIKIKSDNPYEDTLSIKPKVRAIISLGPGSLPGFQGARMQRGLGLGSLFRVFYRTALPPFAKIEAKLLGTALLDTSANIMKDVAKGRNFRKSVEKRESKED